MQEAEAVAPDFGTREHSSMSKRNRHAAPAPEVQGDGQPSSAEERDDSPSQETESDTAPSAAGSDGALVQQLAEQRDKYLRLAAEYDNFRRRTAKERLEASSRGQADLVSKLIDALD